MILYKYQNGDTLTVRKFPTPPASSIGVGINTLGNAAHLASIAEERAKARAKKDLYSARNLRVAAPAPNTAVSIADQNAMMNKALSNDADNLRGYAGTQNNAMPARHPNYYSSDAIMNILKSK